MSSGCVGAGCCSVGPQITHWLFVFHIIQVPLIVAWSAGKVELKREEKEWMICDAVISLTHPPPYPTTFLHPPEEVGPRPPCRLQPAYPVHHSVYYNHIPALQLSHHSSRITELFQSWQKVTKQHTHSVTLHVCVLVCYTVLCTHWTKCLKNLHIYSLAAQQWV